MLKTQIFKITMIKMNKNLAISYFRASYPRWYVQAKSSLFLVKLCISPEISSENSLLILHRSGSINDKYTCTQIRWFSLEVIVFHSIIIAVTFGRTGARVFGQSTCWGYELPWRCNKHLSCDKDFLRHVSVVFWLAWTSQCAC